MIIENSIKRLAARVAIFVLTWAVLFLAFDYLLMPLYTRKFREIPVPSVVGTPLYQAMSMADRYGFEIVRDRTRPDAKHAPETVVDQRPKAGTKAKEGRMIFVTVAARVAQVTTPNLFELSPREATLRLEEVGLSLDTSPSGLEYSDLVSPGFVTRQDPPAGTPVRTATNVKIILSKGPAPGKLIVPDFTGQLFLQAKKLMKQTNLSLIDPVFERSLDVSEGYVVRQNPPAGTVVESGAGIELVISTGK